MFPIVSAWVGKVICTCMLYFVWRTANSVTTCGLYRCVGFETLTKANWHHTAVNVDTHASEQIMSHMLWSTWPIIQPIPWPSMTRDLWPIPRQWHESITTTYESWWVHDHCLLICAVMYNLKFWIWLIQWIFYSIEYSTSSTGSLRSTLYPRKKLTQDNVR